MKFAISLLAGMVAMLTAANAACPNNAPRIGWNVHTDDQQVDVSFLNKTLVGAKLVFTFNNQKSTEDYRSDGSYSYKDPTGTYNPRGYKFYSNGVRCLDYPRGARFDRYVVNSGKLLLINQQGGRFEAKIR